MKTSWIKYPRWQVGIKKIILLPLLLLSVAQAEEIRLLLSDEDEGITQCKVIQVINGNVIRCLHRDKTRENISLYAIEAPSIAQPYGKSARQALSKMVLNKHVLVKKPHDNNAKNIKTIYTVKDCYDRVWPEQVLTGKITDPSSTEMYCEERENINRTMIAKGYAWYNPSYQDNHEYEQVEKDARAAKHGLWADPHPIPPWEWKKQKKSK